MSMPSPQSLATEVPLASQHADRIVKALSGSAGGGGGGGGWNDGHAQLILYWAAEERHVSYAITAAHRLDVSLLKAYTGPNHNLVYNSETPRRRSSWL